MKNRYKVSFWHNGNKKTITGFLIGRNILGFHLFKVGKEVFDVSPAAIIEYKSV